MVPICFAYDGSFFYTAIDRKPKRVAPTRLARLKNISITPQVALLIDQYDEDWTRLWYVLVRGEAKLVSAAAERKRALAQLRAKYPQYRAGMLADDAPIVRITPQRITSWGEIDRQDT
jgi:PPOX class probable F420-dependent enzyme